MAKRGLAVILVVYLVLAASYAAVVPFGQAPDETAHALYIEHLVRERRLPVLRRERRDAYEYHQPPLYYVLAAPAWAAAQYWIEGSGPIQNPESKIQSRTQAARAVSILIGAVGVWLIAALAWAGWPGRDALALGAAGLAALLPMRLATAASVSNDTLAEAVFTAALLVMVRMLGQEVDLYRAAGLGALLGLGILTKSSDLLLFPVALVALLLASQTAETGVQTFRRSGDGSPTFRSENAGLPPGATQRLNTGLFLRCAAVTFGVALLIGGGWMARTAVLYGDPLGTTAFEQYFQDTATTERVAQEFGYTRLELLRKKVLPLTFDSFWGVFRHMTLFMGTYPKGAPVPAWAHVLADRGYPPPSWLYPLLLLATLVAVTGLGKLGVRCWVLGVGDAALSPTPNTKHLTPNTALLLALAWFLVVAAFLRFNTEFFQAQGRYLFPALGPIALGLTAGWLAWWPERRQGAAAALLLMGMVALALYALLGTLLPAY